MWRLTLESPTIESTSVILISQTELSESLVICEQQDRKRRHLYQPGGSGNNNNKKNICQKLSRSMMQQSNWRQNKPIQDATVEIGAKSERELDMNWNSNWHQI